jgi:ankyrin repeat protein
MPALTPTDLLFAAIKARDLPAVKTAISLGADLHSRSGQVLRTPRTPLDEAVYAGSLEVLSLLIDAGCRPSRSNKTLHYAIESGSLPIFRKILDIAPSKAYIVGTKNSYTHLVHAVQLSDIKMCSMLIERGANPKFCDKDGKGLLYYVFGGSIHRSGHAIFELVSFLLKSGTLVNKSPPANDISILQRAVHFCVANQSFIDDGLGIKLLELIIRAGANVNEITRHGTALHVVALNGSSLFDSTIIPFLINSGADVNAKNNFSQTPLHCAVASPNSPGDITKVHQLLAGGADVTIQDSAGRTALHWAASASAARVLLEAGIDPSVQDSFGQTAESYISVDENRPEVYAFLRASRERLKLDKSILGAVISSPPKRV